MRVIEVNYFSYSLNPFVYTRVNRVNVYRVVGHVYQVNEACMMTIDGKRYPTISDAAKRFRVAQKTVYSWIEKGWISEPPTVPQGTKNIQIFPDDYMRSALAAIAARVKIRRRSA